ncbi:serine O-acetyltransferase [Vreelandella neptunia]|uniref:Serine acetyltransferase n=1 Tax=Vreelandella neptunia TaxID=115551 RepID=A0ABS9S787_9GAMM|nr:hypothetical protein [Halomonas neptunia]MCH4811974.1 hypothetical protein [Halomonas neptunia]
MLKNNIYDFVRLFIGSPSARCRALVRLMNVCRVANYMRVAKFFSNRLKAKGLHISHKSKIDRTLSLPHPIAIVIGEGVVVKKNVSIYQNVTLGGARLGDAKDGNYPTVNEGAVIFAGAVVVGNVTLGKNCIIGANSVVLIDVPDNAVCAGVPAKIISENTKRLSDI